MSAASNSQCPVCRTAEVVCGKWTLLVIRDLAEGSSRFCELERSLEGISPRTLSLRLRALEEEGIVERHTFPEVPPRVEYALTRKGEALVPLVEDMRRYGTRWLFEDAAEPADADRQPTRSELTFCKRPCRRRSAGPGAEAGACVIDSSTIPDPPCLRGGDPAQRAGRRRRPDPLRRRRRQRRRLALLQLPAADLAIRARREAELRGLDAFAPARDAVAAAGIAPAYLEARGEPVPADPGERAAQMLTVFLASLWDGSTELSLDHERLSNALAVLEAETRGVEEADVLIAPLVGLRMPLPRLQLPHGVQIVRADAIEAPVEAKLSGGMGRAAWEPQFLAIAEQGEGSESAEAALSSCAS